ncbi:MAG: site-2 protease family protein [bacterium]|nr:site-2 protease family protein [bacterium]
MFGAEFFQRAIIWGPVILFSLTVHEFCHAWSAHKFGDDTARRMGRMTLNPLAHLELFGTLVMVMSQFTFGWAKPVPVNLSNVRNPRTADIWVSAAGPLSNIGLAIIAGLIYQIVGTSGLSGQQPLTQILTAGVYINITLAVFNMIPVFPLDGSHILRNLLPPQGRIAMAKFDRFAPIVLILLIVTRVTWVVLGPIVYFLAHLFMGT